MLTRAILFLLAMMTGLSAAEAADRARLQPAEIARGLITGEAALASATAAVRVRHHAQLIRHDFQADHPQAALVRVAASRLSAISPAHRLRPDVALE